MFWSYLLQQLITWADVSLHPLPLAKELHSHAQSQPEVCAGGRGEGHLRMLIYQEKCFVTFRFGIKETLSTSVLGIIRYTTRLTTTKTNLIFCKFWRGPKLDYFAICKRRNWSQRSRKLVILNELFWCIKLVHFNRICQMPQITAHKYILPKVIDEDDPVLYYLLTSFFEAV